MLLRLGYRDGRNGWCGLFLNDGVEWGKRMVKSEDIKEMENVRNGLNCGFVGIVMIIFLHFVNLCGDRKSFE